MRAQGSAMCEFQLSILENTEIHGKTLVFFVFHTQGPDLPPGSHKTNATQKRPRAWGSHRAQSPSVSFASKVHTYVNDGEGGGLGGCQGQEISVGPRIALFSIFFSWKWLRIALRGAPQSP